MTPADFRPLEPSRVVVLSGGDSAERAVSLESGTAVARALAERGHRVETLDPVEVDLEGYDYTGLDAVFLALHGGSGEDGRVQQVLEAAGVPFTGSDSTASRLAFSKSASKERFAQFDVPTPPYVLIHESDDAARIERQARKLGYPLVVKPDCQGSSLGVSIVTSAQDLPRALTRCFHYDAFGVLEGAVLGSEWTAGFLDGLMLPLVQIETSRGFYDYEAKYLDEETQYRFEFALPIRVVKSIERAARGACEALGTRGLARVDLRLDRYNRPWVLEVNTVPGLTGHSLIPKAAARAGIEFGELCEQAVRCARQSPAARPQS